MHKQMYNFLAPKLCPKISSATPATDNYEVTNLINENALVRSRGFLAYGAIKPPVEIDFELICPINLHYISIVTTLGSQKCTAIEILMKRPNAYFTSVGQAYFNTNGVIFCNARLYALNNLPENMDKSFHVAFFKNNLFRIVSNANVIKVRILRTDKSVPCVGKIEIWGKISKMCSQITASTIEHLMAKTSLLGTASRVLNTQTPTQHKIDHFLIPDDFKDALTYETMSIPMTLPSGNTVDQSTIEKCVAFEASYGRHPSDPFTGQKFTASQKPILNGALKSRIDMFLIENSHQTETFTIKRTLGKSSNKTQTESSIVLQSNNLDSYSKRKIDSDDVFVDKKLKFDDGNQDSDLKLEEAIQKTVGSSSFIKFTEHISDSGKRQCMNCDEKSSLYSLPCNHVYCRQCLLNICVNLICSSCKITFSKSDPQKYHPQ